MLISDEVGWVDRYRGLWGLDTRDPVGGERAPSGPKYNRDGSVRQSWYDPLGWAGLDKVLPPTDLPGELDDRLKSVETELQTSEAEIQTRRAALRDLALDVEAMRETGYMSASLKKKEKQLEVDQKELQGLEASHNDAREAHKALSRIERASHAAIGQPRPRIFATVSILNPHRHRSTERWKCGRPSAAR